MAEAEAIRIANCSGFYGDRLTAMREMLDGGPVDVITGDYLAELTMLILGKDQLKDPNLGYARILPIGGGASEVLAELSAKQLGCTGGTR